MTELASTDGDIDHNVDPGQPDVTYYVLYRRGVILHHTQLQRGALAAIQETTSHEADQGNILYYFYTIL